MLGSPVFINKPAQPEKGSNGHQHGNTVLKNAHLKNVYNGDVTGGPLLGSAPALGGKYVHKKRSTALPLHLDPHFNNSRIYKTSSIVSFDDSPMLAADDQTNSHTNIHKVGDNRKARRRTVHNATSPLVKNGCLSHKFDEEAGEDEKLCGTESPDLPDSETSETSSNMDDELSRIPDGGYGWIVVAMSFCMQALVGGIAYVQGLMYPCFQEAMNADKVTTAWACSMQMSIWFTGGLVSGPLVQVYGARRISMLGTIVVAFGLLISAFATHIWMLYVFYGFMCGFGMSMIFFPAVIIVQHYFTTKRSIAVAFANAGTPFGAFSYPILVSYLIRTFGWRGELVILSAITLHGLVFASFFRPVFTKPKQTEKPPLLRKLSQQSRTVPEVIISSVVSLGQDSITSEERSKLHDFLTNLIDLSLWKNPNMVFDIFAYGFFAFGFIMPSMFLPLKASENDILPPKPEILLSVLGFSDVIGRLTSGLIGRLLGKKRLVIYGSGMVVCGIATVLSSFIDQFGPLVVYSSIFGICIGMSRAYSSVVVTDMLGIANLPKAYGFKMFINGICVLCSGPLAAYIFELTSNVDLAFRLIGLIQFLGGSLVFILLVLRRFGCAEVI